MPVSALGGAAAALPADWLGRASLRAASTAIIASTRSFIFGSHAGHPDLWHGRCPSEVNRSGPQSVGWCSGRITTDAGAHPSGPFDCTLMASCSSPMVLAGVALTVCDARRTSCLTGALPPVGTSCHMDP